MRVAAFVLFSVCLAASASAADSWTCRAKNQDGWISDSYSIRPDGDGYLVSDAFSDEMNGGPVEAKAKDNGKTLTLQWRVLVSDSSGQTAYMAYRASIFREQGNAFSIRAQPEGYDNTFESRGVCQPS